MTLERVHQEIQWNKLKRLPNHMIEGWKVGVVRGGEIYPIYKETDIPYKKGISEIPEHQRNARIEMWEIWFDRDVLLFDYPAGFHVYTRRGDALSDLLNARGYNDLRNIAIVRCQIHQENILAHGVQEWVCYLNRKKLRIKNDCLWCLPYTLILSITNLP